MINRATLISCLLIILLVILIVGISCSLSSVNTSSKISNAAQTSPLPDSKDLVPTATRSEQTVDQLCQDGNAVYVAACVKCHGSFEQPVGRHPLTGPGANLAKYTNARGLLDFMSTAMPPSVPGSLPSQSYLQVLACLLLKNEFVSPETVIDPGKLEKIKLSR
jgi:hypothetical protein